MLCELTIRNIALIESLTIEFDRGLNALTGETGAGKSIVVDCVNLALGQRGGRELLRTGEEKASVKALFDIQNCDGAKAYLDESGIDYDDGYVELSRDINAAGRNVCRINGTLVPQATLRDFASTLVDLHGQQEHQRLLSPANHVQYLDAFAGEEAFSALSEMKAAHAEYLAAKRASEQLDRDERELMLRLDLLNLQNKEITAAKLREDEEEELLQKSKIYDNAEKLTQYVRVAYERLYQGGKSLSAQDSIKKAADALGAVSDIDPAYSELAARLEELLFAVKDIGYEVQSRYEELSFDPAEAERVQDRLETIKKLKRKYGPEIKDVLEHGRSVREELKRIENMDSSREEAKQALDQAAAKLKECADRLYDVRKISSEKLETEVMKQLKELGMGSTVFRVDFRPRKEISAGGDRDVEFMVSTNPGEPLKPLAAIASGGEISRLMLALKVILADNDGIDTMIFDEIDTGISGRMAQTVGEKMSLLGKNKQVVCVTHLAQIAALADTQYVVEKTVRGGRTGSAVTKLDFEGRVEEISRLVGGAETDESRTEHAKSMLKSAEARKQLLREGAGS